MTTWILAAVAGSSSFALLGLEAWRHWPRLTVEFTWEFKVTDDHIILSIRIGNRGGGTLHQVDLSGVAAGASFRPLPTRGDDDLSSSSIQRGRRGYLTSAFASPETLQSFFGRMRTRWSNAAKRERATNEALLDGLHDLP